jgi:hypothetical protein
MDPLSPWTYARRNLRKVLPTLIILSFVVLLVIVLLTTFRGLKESLLVYTREFDHWTMIFPKADTALPDSLRRELAAHPSVDRVIDTRNCFLRVKALIAHVPYHVRGVRQEDMTWLMARAGVSLREGALPRPDTNEVALHENFMKANAWALGREFGMDADDDDWMPGRFKVVGILEGPTPLGVASFEYLNNPVLYAYSPKLWQRVLVAPRPGRSGELNAHLRALPAIKSWDKSRAVEEVTESFDRILLILNFISLTLIVVVSIVVGLIQNIFFGQRMDEFAILMAIGHTRRRLLRKVTAETAGIMAFSWTVGAAAGLALMAVFRSAVLVPRGIPLPLVQGVPLAVSMLLPFVALLFAALTVAGRLRRLDAVTIIERRG